MDEIWCNSVDKISVVDFYNIDCYRGEGKVKGEGGEWCGNAGREVQRKRISYFL